MCGLAGVIFGKKRRRAAEREHLAWLFTRLLILSEERGPHATGAAWLDVDGGHRLFKRPVTAERFVTDKAFAELLASMDKRAALLLGHTRWRTRGDERVNSNNHPIRAGEVIGTHNGTIYNADYLFRRWKMRRFAEVDSEILFRLAANAARDGTMDIERFKTRLRRCRGQITAVIACRTDPGTVLVLKGNRPLELRWHPRRKAVLYASDPAYLDAVLAEEKGLEGASGPAHEPGGVPARGPGRVFGGALRVRRPGEKAGGTMTDTPMNQAMNPREPSNANTSGMLRLFVYGTLKRGFWNHDRFCRGVLTVEDAVVRGLLFETSSGIPVLLVLEEDILAVGTTNPHADVATQAHVTARMSNPEPTPDRLPSKGTGAPWGPVYGELLTFDDPETRLPAIDRLEGFHPGGPCLYRRVLVSAQAHGTVLPGTKAIDAASYLLSFLALKLLGTERHSHAPDHAFDPGLGLFAGLNVLPKSTAMSTYSYRLDHVHLQKLQQAFVQQADKLGLYDKSVVNLDFHTIPHFGDESVLEKHWAGARNKTMKGALTLFAQDAESRLIVYTAADIRRSESDEQVTNFLAYWKKLSRGVLPTFVFDSRFTSYQHLSELNAHGVRFITLRRRGRKLMKDVEALEPWTKISIPHAKRKYPNPLVHDSALAIRGYDGPLRQVVIRGNGHEKPAFLISNDFDTPVELLVGNYSRRWRVENAISEAVDFFNLNSLSSPILVKVHFDVVMTMIADTLYHMLAVKLRGFEHCDAPKLFRHFVRGKGVVKLKGQQLTVTFPRRAHNPILRSVPWHRLPSRLSWLNGVQLRLNFE